MVQLSSKKVALEYRTPFKHFYCSRGSMDFRRPIKLLIIMALIIYFLCKIFNAEVKLGEGRIGTLITTIQSDTVQGNHLIVIVAL